MKSSGIVLFLILILAGCTGTTRNQEPTLLHVVRPALVGYNQQPVGSLDRTISGAEAVQRLYTAALALPHPGQYPLPCTDDFGLIYHLTFMEGTSQLQQVDVQPLGCHWVYLSQTDVRQANQSFLALLTSTIGLASLIPAGLLPPS